MCLQSVNCSCYQQEIDIQSHCNVLSLLDLQVSFTLSAWPRRGKEMSGRAGAASVLHVHAAFCFSIFCNDVHRYNCIVSSHYSKSPCFFGFKVIAFVQSVHE